MAHRSSMASPQPYRSYKHQEELLSLLADLFRHGVHEHVSLPHFVICGEPGSGKTSVLAALSELDLKPSDTPTPHNLFTTKVYINKDDRFNASFNIEPSSGRSRQSQESLRNAAVVQSVNDLEAIFTRAGPDQSCTGEDVVRINVRGPHTPSMTVFEVPGMLSRGEGLTTEEHRQELVGRAEDYMSEACAIVLVIVAADTVYADRFALRMAHTLDPSGDHTMGILTKHDHAERDEAVEGKVEKLMQNKDVGLELGWHMLRNQSMEEYEGDKAQAARDPRREKNKNMAFSRPRDAREALHFMEGEMDHYMDEWGMEFPRHQLGIENLRKRLSCILYEHTVAVLPWIIAGVKAELSELRATHVLPIHMRDIPSHQTLAKFAEAFARSISIACGVANDPADTPNLRHMLEARLVLLEQQFAGATVLLDADEPPGGSWQTTLEHHMADARTLNLSVINDFYSRGKVHTGVVEPLIADIRDMVGKSLDAVISELNQKWILADAVKTNVILPGVKKLYQEVAEFAWEEVYRHGRHRFHVDADPQVLQRWRAVAAAMHMSLTADMRLVLDGNCSACQTTAVPDDEHGAVPGHDPLGPWLEAARLCAEIRCEAEMKRLADVFNIAKFGALLLCKLSETFPAAAAANLSSVDIRDIVFSKPSATTEASRQRSQSKQNLRQRFVRELQALELKIAEGDNVSAPAARLAG